MTDLADLYAATRIEFPSLDGHPAMLVPRPLGETGEWPFEGHSEAWIVTAENPGSGRTGPNENAGRRRQLDRRLDLLGLAAVVCRGVGDPEMPGDPPWVEESRLLVGAPRELVVEIAREFGQNAVFRWTPASRDVVGVLESLLRSHGWALIRCDDTV